MNRMNTGYLKNQDYYSKARRKKKFTAGALQEFPQLNNTWYDTPKFRTFFLTNPVA